MVHSGIFATADQCKYKAGVYASATSSAEAYINAFCSMAESVINVMSGYNWSDAYASLNADVKGILTEAESSLVAMYILNYDLTGFSARTAETMLDILYNSFTRAIEALKQAKAQDFTRGA